MSNYHFKKHIAKRVLRRQKHYFTVIRTSNDQVVLTSELYVNAQDMLDTIRELKRGDSLRGAVVL